MSDHVVLCPMISSRTHDDFIPLVEEVRLKRPDLYGFNSHDLDGSVQLEGSRSTSLPAGMTGGRERAGDLNHRVRDTTAEVICSGTVWPNRLARRDMTCSSCLCRSLGYAINSAASVDRAGANSVTLLFNTWYLVDCKAVTQCRVLSSYPTDLIALHS